MQQKGNIDGAIINLAKWLWKLNLKLHGINTVDLPETIRRVWERAGVCVKEGSNTYYPTLNEQAEDADGNPVLYYKLPAGMDYGEIVKKLPRVNAYMKSEVIAKGILENDPRGHFSLTVLKGTLKDRIVVNLTDLVAEVKAKGKGLWIPIGYSRRRLECVNLASDNSSHVMIGGSIGGGKSTLLRLIMVVLHLAYTTREVVMWVCDFKHGNEMKILGKDPLMFTRTCKDPELAEEFFAELYEEVQRRYQLFHECPAGDVTNITEYNKIVDAKIPHIVLVIDELGKLEGNEYKVARRILKHIAGDGRAAGVHVIISMHRPTANLVDGTLKNNISVVVGFRCNPVSARVIFGEDEWQVSQSIDPDVAGRAVFLYTDHVLVQVPWLSEETTHHVMSAYQKPKSITPTDEVILRA